MFTSEHLSPSLASNNINPKHVCLKTKYDRICSPFDTMICFELFVAILLMVQKSKNHLDVASTELFHINICIYHSLIRAWRLSQPCVLITLCHLFFPFEVSLCLVYFCHHAWAATGFCPREQAWGEQGWRVVWRLLGFCESHTMADMVAQSLTYLRTLGVCTYPFELPGMDLYGCLHIRHVWC